VLIATRCYRVLGRGTKCYYVAVSRTVLRGCIQMHETQHQHAHAPQLDTCRHSPRIMPALLFRLIPASTIPALPPHTTVACTKQLATQGGHTRSVPHNTPRTRTDRPALLGMPFQGVQPRLASPRKSGCICAHAHFIGTSGEWPRREVVKLLAPMARVHGLQTSQRIDSS
jgi:hypothetical protein